MNKKKFNLYFSITTIVLAILTSMLVGAIILLSINANVFKTYFVILTQPLKNIGLISEVLLRAIPLSIIALGIAVAYRSGIINIGAEGQMLMGILGASIPALTLPAMPSFIVIFICILTGCLFGALWGFIPGVLRAKLEVSELLSTVMLNYIAAQIYTLMLRGPLLDPAEITMGSGTPQSMRFPRYAQLSKLISGTRLHSGLIIVIVLAVLIYFLLWRTSFGFQMRAAGSQARAAKYGGINVSRYLIIAMMISGMFAGLAGSIEVLGVHKRAIEGISNNYGFSAIVVALFGGLHPAGILPASFFFGLLLVGADMTQRMVGVPANMVQVLQGIIILVIVSTKMILNNPYLKDKVYRKLQERKHA